MKCKHCGGTKSKYLRFGLCYTCYRDPVIASVYRIGEKEMRLRAQYDENLRKEEEMEPMSSCLARASWRAS